MVRMHFPQFLSSCLVGDTDSWMVLSFCCFLWLFGCTLCLKSSSIHRNSQIFGEILGQQHRNFPLSPALWHWSLAWLPQKWLCNQLIINYWYWQLLCSFPQLLLTFRHLMCLQFCSDLSKFILKADWDIFPHPFGLNVGSSLPACDKLMLSCLLECLNVKLSLKIHVNPLWNAWKISLGAWNFCSQSWGLISWAELS